MPDSTPLAALLDDWTTHLQAERKSPQTVRSYTRGVAGFLAWCAETGAAPELSRRKVNAWTSFLLAEGGQAATVRARQLAVRRFSAWCAAEDEIPRDELSDLTPPKLDTKVVDPLSEDQLRALLAACSGKTFLARRDEALVRVMLETGARASEVVGMTCSGTDTKNGSVLITRGKGGKGRRAPVSAKTCDTLNRYVRTRRNHRLADTDALWLGDRGKGFSYDGLFSALKARAQQAGIPDFHPHRMRHTAATRWLAAGGSEGGLMAVAGWSRRDMLDRYTRATSESRAAEEARRLGLGDL